MDIKDAKVGMLVQLNPNYTGYMFPALRYMQETGEPLEVVSITNEYIRVRYEGSALGFYPASFEPYQDPEADMVVWDALEVGKHYIDHEGYERVKMCEKLNYCFPTRTIHLNYGVMDRYEKVKPL